MVQKNMAMSLTNDHTEQKCNDLGLHMRSNAENRKVAKQVRAHPHISMIIDPIHKLHREFQMSSNAPRGVYKQFAFKTQTQMATQSLFGRLL